MVSVLFGKTGRNLMDLLAEDQTELTLQAVQACLKGRLKTKATELFQLCKGSLRTIIDGCRAKCSTGSTSRKRILQGRISPEGSVAATR